MISTFDVRCLETLFLSFLDSKLKSLTIICDCTPWFLFDLVGNLVTRRNWHTFRWITKGYQEAYNYYISKLHEAISPDNDVARIARLMKMYDDALKCTNVDELCSMITEYKLTWEHLPTTMLNHLKIWQTLLRNMPIEALVRNLGRMTRVGVFPDNSEEEEIAVEKIKYDVSLF